MSPKIPQAQAILALAVKWINSQDAAITEKKIWSFPLYSQWIQDAVREGYIRVIECEWETPKYFLSEHGVEFMEAVIRLLEE